MGRFADKGMTGQLAGILTCLILSSGAAQVQDKVDFSKEIQAAKDKVYPALVHILAVAQDYQGGESHKHMIQGSGTIISPDGLVLTNFHVAGDGVKFLCTLSNKEQISADYVGGDYLTDLSIIRLDLGERTSKTPLPYARLGDSDKVRIGDYVMAMGAPYGIARTVTAGIVSNNERSIRTGAGTYPRGRSDIGMFTSWIQHDATVYPGNSGGPLVNMKGEVIGVNTIGSSPGIAYAVPSNLAKDLLGTVFKYKNLPRSDFGIELQHLVKGYSDQGALISYVYPDTPAHEAGLRAGDVLIKANGHDVNARFQEDIPLVHRLLAGLPIDKEAEFTILRDGKEMTVGVKSWQREDEVLREMECKKLGITVREISRPTVLKRRLKDNKGVIITGVKPGSPAAVAEPALMPGDIIKVIGGKEIAGYDSFVEVYRHLKAKKAIVVEFERWFDNYITLVKPKSETKATEDNASSSLFMKKGWLGCSLQLVKEELAAELFGDKKLAGYRITKVYKDSPADNAGLKEGDVVLKVDGKAVIAKRAQDVAAFLQKFRMMSKGDKIKLAILREGKETEIEVTIDFEPKNASDVKPVTDEDFGLTVRDLVFYDRVAMNLKESEGGVIIVKTEPGGWADFSREFPAGGLIMKIDGADIKNTDDFKKAMEKAKIDKKKYVIFYVYSGGTGSFRAVETEWDEND